MRQGGAKGKETWASAPSALLSARICPCHLLLREIEFGGSWFPCLFIAGRQASLVIAIPPREPQSPPQWLRALATSHSDFRTASPSLPR